jgi:AAA15 family ATPase/GTPase
MYLKRVVVNKYKSIKNAGIEFLPGLNILIGKNGAGKSNLLNFIAENVNYETFEGAIFRSWHANSNILNFEFEAVELERDEPIFKFIFSLNSKPRNFATGRSSTDVKLILTNFGANTTESTDITVSGSAGSTELIVNGEVKTKNVGVNFELNRYISLLKELPVRLVGFGTPESSFWLSKEGFDFEFSFSEGFEFHDLPINLYFFSDFTKYLEKYIWGRFKDDIKNNIFEGESAKVETFLALLNEAFSHFLNEVTVTEYLSYYSPITDLRLSPLIAVYRTAEKFLITNVKLEFNVNNVWIPWKQLSDGTKRLFHIISECTVKQSGVLLIEEPELGVHPHQLFSLMGFLKEQSRYMQIIITTHSPNVLEVLDSNELNRITVAKLTDNGTQFFKLTEEQIHWAKKHIEEEGDLSYYWVHSDLES